MAKARPARSKGGGWVTTFADLMALLLTFFILMMTFSTIEIEKYEAMVASFSKGFKSIGILTGSQGVLSGQDAVSIVPAVVDTPSGGSGEATLDQPELTIGEAADTTISPEQYSLYRQFSYALDEQIGDGSVSIGLGEGAHAALRGACRLSPWRRRTQRVASRYSRNRGRGAGKDRRANYRFRPYR